MHKLIVTSTEEATRAIARGLDRALGAKLKVLWLLSGGSNVAVELKVLKQLQNATPERLAITLIDERHVAPNSPDSNWRKLLDAGLTDDKARLMPVVVDAESDLQATAQDFERRLSEELEWADVVIGQFGIGADGHTAGILPHSPGVQEHDKLVVGYKGPDFERVTTTPALFARLSLATVVAMGREKLPALQQLGGEGLAEDTPARLLLLSNDLIVYTDQEVEWV